MYVSPSPIEKDDVFSEDWKGFVGPAVQLSVSSGGTSGRFTVAKVIARIFPDYHGFVRDVIAEGIEPADHFPNSPFPGDTLRYLSNKEVEFITAPNSQGLGTNGALRKNAEPIKGAVILAGVDTDVWQLSMRLPKSSDELGPAITQQFEREVSHIRR
jgi:hypothetical protein